MKRILYSIVIVVFLFLVGCKTGISSSKAITDNKASSSEQDNIPKPIIEQKYEAKDIAVSAVIASGISGGVTEESQEVLGSNEDLSKIKEALKKINEENLTVFMFEQFPSEFEGSKEIDKETSIILFNSLKNLDVTVKEDWSNPPTGGGWEALLETDEMALSITYNGEWIVYSIKNEEKIFIYDIKDQSIGEYIDNILWEQ